MADRVRDRIAQLIYWALASFDIKKHATRRVISLSQSCLGWLRMDFLSAGPITGNPSTFLVARDRATCAQNATLRPS